MISMVSNKHTNISKRRGMFELLRTENTNMYHDAEINFFPNQYRFKPIKNNNNKYVDRHIYNNIQIIGLYMIVKASM